MKQGLDLSLGAIEVAVLLASVFYGLVLIQTYVYALSCKNDRPVLKVVVGLVGCFETIHMISTWAYLYDLTVRNFGNPLALASLTWGLCLAISMQAAAGGLVQIFYVWRVHIVSQRWWLALPPFIGAMLRIAIGFAIAGLAYGSKVLPHFQERHSFTVYIATISSAAVDLWNTAALCFFLRTRSTGHVSTQNVVKRAIMWAIETGIITSSASILLVVFWSTMPGNALWLAVMLIYAKLYSNSLLVSLNARASVTRTPSSGHNFEGPGPSPVIITRTRNMEVSQHSNLPLSKSDYGSDTMDIPLSDFHDKQEREGHPFDAC